VALDSPCSFNASRGADHPFLNGTGTQNRAKLSLLLPRFLIMPIFALAPNSQRLGNFGLAYRAPLLSGEGGTKQTIQVMRRLVDQAVSDPTFVRQAIEIVRGVLPYNDIAEAQAVYTWVQRNIRYTKDPVTKEKLYSPQDLLKIRAGDCDDISMLMGALMIALGYPARLITISANPQNPEEFVHVYLEAEVPPGSSQWIPMDAARADAQFGIAPPFYYRKRAWSLTDDSYQDLSGCGCKGGRCGCSSVGKVGLRGLAGVATISGWGLGQDDGIDYSSLLSQTLTETPALIAAASGQPIKYQTGSSVVATGPYSSFATPLTPGATVPAGGYSAVPTTANTAWFSANWPMIALLGLGAVLLMGRR
jgi:hypothetical protein